MKNILRLFAVTVFAVATVFGGISVAQEQTTNEDSAAAGASGFRVTPPRDELTIEQGETVVRSITVRNVTSFTQTARAVIDDFGPSDDESGTPNLLIGDLAVDNYQYSIKPFVASIPDFTLEPGQETEVLVTFSVPSDASPGSYFGVVRFLTLNEVGEVEGTGAVALNASVGTIYLIQVPGETTDLLTLEQAGAAQDGQIRSLFSSAPNTMIYRLKNEGNTFQAPFGNVIVRNWSGDTVYEYQLNNVTPRGNVLPGSIRRFEDQLQNIGSFGRYTVEANISYGDGGNIITARTTFWVIPWTTVGIAIVVLVALGYGASRGLKAYNKKVIDSSKGTRVKKK